MATLNVQTCTPSGLNPACRPIEYVTPDDVEGVVMFDPIAWAQTPEGAEAIAGFFGAGMSLPLIGYAIGFGAGSILRMISGR